MQSYSLQVALCSLFFYSSASQAGVIRLQNQSPLIAIFGLPAPVDFVESKKYLSLSLNVANNFVPRASVHETLLLDGETSRLIIHHRQQLSQCWMFGIELPLVHHSGGGLDSFVDQWHAWFGLPESGRPNVASNQLNYQYTVDGQSLVNHSSPTSGIGDVSLIFTQQQRCGHGAGKILRAGVKLPTGDSEFLFGSGAADAFVDVSQRLEDIYSSLTASYTVGLLLMGKSRVPVKHHKHAVYGSLNLEVPLNPKLSLEAQIAVQSPLIESHLRVLSDWPVQLLIGTSFQMSKSMVWSAALSEDPEYGTSSDVVFQMSMRTSF